MTSVFRQTVIYALVLIAVAALSVVILSKSLRYPVDELELTSAIPSAPAKPDIFAEEAAEDALPEEVDRFAALPASEIPGFEVATVTAESAAETPEPEAPALKPVQTVLPAIKPAQAEITPDKPAPVAVKSASKPMTAAKSAEVMPAPAVRQHGWSVRVGTFANHQLATNIIRDLRDQGYSTYSRSEMDYSSGKQLKVVYVGPEGSQLDAEDLRAELQVMENLDGKVIFVK